jgi:hypothetical protein
VSTEQSTFPQAVRPPQGTPAELEATQRWWLTWVYGPVMGVLAVAAVVAAAVGDASPYLAGALVGVIVGSAAGAVARFRTKHRTTGGLALDERDETSNMRTMGYAFCFVYFGVLAWAVAWTGFDGRGTPEPWFALIGLTVALGLGRLCTRREGF